MYVAKELYFVQKRICGRILSLVLLVASFCSGSALPEDFWKTKEPLVSRLTAEWHKVGVLRRDTESLDDILAALQDIEVYPVELTGMNDRNVIMFDRALEGLLKKNKQIKSRIDDFEQPVTDALKIMREMIIDQPVDGMFDALEKSNLRRISEMILVKHAIDTLWKRTDSLLTAAMTISGYSEERHHPGQPIEEEFFALIKANLGLQAEQYFSRMAPFKKYLVRKAGSEQLLQMTRIDTKRIESCIADKKYRLAENKISELLSWANDNSVITKIMMLMAKVQCAQRHYQEVLATLETIPASPDNHRLGELYRIQSLYGLEAFPTIVDDTSRATLYDLTGADLNFVVWLTIESCLRIKKPEAGIRIARFADRHQRYAAHVMHALARSFIALGDDTTAGTVLQEGEACKAYTAEDREIVVEIRFSRALLHYKQGNFQLAADLMYRQIGEPGMFERALSGIAWCYINMHQFTKAETALRKLINQSPESILGAEGILTLARYYLQSAGEQWNAQVAIDKRHHDFEVMLARIAEKTSYDSNAATNAALADAKARILILLEQLHKNNESTRQSIISCYANIDKLCTFIASHYYTGTFQETIFSSSRERTLSIIDSVLGRTSPPASHKLTDNTAVSDYMRKQFKQLVERTSLFSTLATIEKFRWEIEYLDREKKQINRKIAVTVSDTASPVLQSDSPALRNVKSIDSLLMVEQSVRSRYTQLLQTSLQSLLQKNFSDSDRCYLLYQLGEINYRDENERYAGAYDTFDIQRKTAMNPTPPVLSHAKSMPLFKEAMRITPSSMFAGAATYSLAWCYNDIGKIDSAFHYMNLLAHSAPGHPHTPQAWMFCGEYFFDKAQLDKALESFSMVMKYPESEWFDDALYKVAWTQYRMSNPQKAISSFLALVDLGKGSFSRALLEKESMDYIAISFSELDASGQAGLSRAAAFVSKFDDKKRGCQILHRLAQVYKEQGRYETARSAYALLLSTYPSYEKNARVEAELLFVLDRNQHADSALDRKYHYFSKYNRTSAWAQKQTDSIRTSADSIAAKMLYEAAVGYHQLALQTQSGTTFTTTIKAYRDFITTYPAFPLANECHYNLAEIQFSLGNYPEAVEEFIVVSQKYPESTYRETAAWNAIVAAQNILKAETFVKEQDRQ